jgi:opacity protein-like surface antigen
MLARGAAAVSLGLLTLSASAQMRGPNENYVGLQLGESRLNLPCAGGFACDRRDTSYKLTLGRTMGPNFGGELSYIDFGTMQRGGGDTKADGVNLSLVGRLPLGNAFGVFGKVGATYGRTRSDTFPLSGLPSGSQRGWGASYALGASYDLTPNWTLVAEWERHRLEVANGGTHDADNTSLGVNYRF